MSGDAELRRNAGQRSHGEPARVLDLAGLGNDVAARPPRSEGDHETVRERPALAAVVAKVRDLYPNLFGGFALDALLDRLARLDEAGKRTVDALGEARRA